MAGCSSAPGREFFSSNIDAQRIGDECRSLFSANDSAVAGIDDAGMPVRLAPRSTIGATVNRIYQPERLFIRQNRLLHLVHHICETDSVFPIGERVAATGARLAECRVRFPKDAAARNLTG